jgi:FkbM family methyltransferase
MAVEASVKRANLIIDVGMHTGGDTEFYLAKGFDVVAIEANPVLVEAARDRFAAEIASGQLQILPVAIAEAEGTLPLAICDEKSSISSMSPAYIGANESVGFAYRYVDVPTRTFESILAEVGVPHYLKVDIEGMDLLCIRALRNLGELPDFVSVESNVHSPGAQFAAIFDELSALWELGYRRFAYVDQSKHPERRPPYPAREGRYADAVFTHDHSGLFGEELPVKWETVDRALLRAGLLRWRYDVIAIGGRWTRTVSSRAHQQIRAGHSFSWYDLHARR